MAGYVGKLEPGDVLLADPYFEGPWRSFERREIPAGRTDTFVADEYEYSIFVTGGEATFVTHGQLNAAPTGTAITIGRGSTVEVTAEAGGAELFITTLRAG